MRTNTGQSLVELLVSTTIMSIVAVSMMSVLLINYRTNAKVASIQDNVDAVRQIKERIATDVRKGRALGDVFGEDRTNSAVSPALVYTVGSDHFPEGTRNPIYGASLPITPVNWPPPPWTLSNTCLIVQVPILDNHNDDPSSHTHAVATNRIGWPTMIPAGWNGPGPTPTVNQDNVETHVYMIVQDPDNPGEFLMQLTEYAGMPVAGYDPQAHTHGPQTILKGITGPLDSTGQPQVFQFISRIKPDGSPDNAILPNGAHSPEYTGVVVNLQVKRHQTMNVARGDISQTPIGMKLEVFMRNNALATSVGQPSAVSGN